MQPVQDLYGTITNGIYFLFHNIIIVFHVCAISREDIYVSVISFKLELVQNHDLRKTDRNEMYKTLRLDM